MKLLVVVSSIYDKDLFKKRKSITGIEIMVRDILNGVFEEIDCSVFTTSLKSKGQRIGKIELLPNDFFCFLRLTQRAGTERFKSFFSELRGMCFIQRFKLAISMTLLDYHISVLKPDIVNIHDLNDWNTYFVKKILPTGVKVLLTDHLYIGKKARTYGYRRLKENEDAIFDTLYKNLFVSFVSSGMRNRFLIDYPSFPHDNVYCVVNGTNTKGASLNDLKRPAVYNRIQGRKVLLCIGGFTARKNQQAIFDAVKLMNQEERDTIRIILIGAGRSIKMNRILQKENVADVIINVETVRPSDMASYYYYSNGTITTSLNESFGLTIIEGFCYGKPAVLFDDIDSFEDIYDKKVCVPIHNHTPADVKQAIFKAICSTWDVDYIKSYVSKFSLPRVQKDYFELYEKINKYIF